MALNSNGKPFGLDVEERLKNVTKVPSPTDKNEYTGTLTPTYSPAHLPRSKNGERKTERLQLSVRPSTKARLAKYAEAHNTSSNEVVQTLLDDLLDRSGY